MLEKSFRKSTLSQSKADELQRWENLSVLLRGNCDFQRANAAFQGQAKHYLLNLPVSPFSTYVSVSWL